MNLYKNIKYLRLKNNLSQSQLGKKLNYERSSIAKIENGSVDLPQSKIQAFADIFGVTPAQLMDGDLECSESNKDLEKIINFVKIPLYSSISCGKGLFVDDHIDDYIAVPNRFIKPNKKYFANYASGDSMIGKGILDGDVLVFEEAPVLENGQIGAFCINNEDAVCKVFRKLRNGIILLESANSNYGPIEIDVMNNDCFRVIGKLVGSFKQF